MLEVIKVKDIGNSSFMLEDLEIELSNINVISGYNNSGKSFLFKFAWFTSMALNIYKVILLSKTPNIDELFEIEVNDLFELTFTESEKLGGAIQIMDKNTDIFVFTLSFKDGKLDYFELDIKDISKFELGNIPNIQYNTADARTFTAYEQYLQTKEILEISNFLNKEDIKKIGKMYRLYDILWFENMNKTIIDYGKEQEKLKGLFEIVNESFKNEKGHSLICTEKGKGFEVKDNILYISTEDTPIKISSTSKGEQSLLMMCLFTSGFGKRL